VTLKMCNCTSESGKKRTRPEFDIKPADFNRKTFGEAIEFMDNLADDIKDGRTPECCASCPFISEQYLFCFRYAYLTHGLNVELRSCVGTLEFTGLDEYMRGQCVTFIALDIQGKELAALLSIGYGGNGAVRAVREEICGGAEKW